MAFVEGEDELDSEEEAAVEEARLALGFRSGVDKNKLYAEVLAPVTPDFSGVRWVHACAVAMVAMPLFHTMVAGAPVRGTAPSPQHTHTPPSPPFPPPPPPQANFL